MSNNKASTYDVIDTDQQLSIRYHNIYAINGELTYLTTNDQQLPLVNKFTNTSSWRPVTKIFRTASELDTYVQSLGTINECELAALCECWWNHCIGHALFDGLYPIYLALVKFGYHDKSFVLLSDVWNKDVMAYDIVTRFSGHELQPYTQLDKNTVIRFKILVAGTGSTGNRVMNQNYTLYGEKEYNALTLFKERMLSRYGIANSPRDPNNSIVNIIIVDNKRYSQYERWAITQIIEHYLKNNISSISYVDWSRYPTFEEQLKVINQTDIQITGPGTGMMYMPFLRKGSVNINLGYIEHTQTNSARPNIFIQGTDKPDFLVPGWMEQSVCAGASYVTTLYYDRYTFNQLEVKPLITLIDRAISLIINPIESNYLNLNTDALVFREYCKRVANPQAVCDHLTNIAFFIELFINEHPHAVPDSIIDIELLRKIKDEFGLNRNYEIKTSILSCPEISHRTRQVASNSRYKNCLPSRV